MDSIGAILGPGCHMCYWSFPRPFQKRKREEWGPCLLFPSSLLPNTTHDPQFCSFFLPSHFILLHISKLCLEYIPYLPFSFNSITLTLRNSLSSLFPLIFSFLFWIHKRPHPSIRLLSSFLYVNIKESKRIASYFEENFI